MEGGSFEFRAFARNSKNKMNGSDFDCYDTILATLPIGDNVFGSTAEHRKAARTVLGMTMEKAQTYFKKKHKTFSIRARVIDGVPQLGEKMCDENRLNVTIEKGVIIAGNRSDRIVLPTWE
jgi:hypothetical protein